MVIKMEDIIKLQKQYFNSNITKHYLFRMEMLKKLKNAIISYQDRIIEALYLDLNKSETEAITTEIWIVLKEIKYHLKHLKKWMKKKHVKTHLLTKPGNSYYLYTPLGVNLIISPWNYPVQLTFMPLIASISAGNTSVLKPSNYSVHTSKVIKDLIDNTFDPAYISCFLGGREQADFLLSQDFDHIFFIGSPTVGKHVLARAANNLTKVTLELGGKSPCIVDETVNVKTIAKRIAFGKLINCGQTCIAPDYVIAQEKVARDLVDAINFEFEKMYPQGTINYQYYPKIISPRHFERLVNLINNENVIYGGKSNSENLKIEPTIIRGDLNSTLMQEEIFGPILPVLTYQNKDEIETIINHNPYPLAFYLFSKDKKLIYHLTRSVRFGGGCINDTLSHIIIDELPFGGIKTSGFGNYHGFHSFKTFSHQASIYHKHHRHDFKMKYMPYSPRMQKLFRKLFLPKIKIK